MCLDRPQHNIAVAEADTHNAAWAPDVVVGISQWAVLSSISGEIAERLVDYGDEPNHQNRASVTSVSGNDAEKITRHTTHGQRCPYQGWMTAAKRQAQRAAMLKAK